MPFYSLLQILSVPQEILNKELELVRTDWFLLSGEAKKTFIANYELKMTLSQSIKEEQYFFNIKKAIFYPFFGINFWKPP